MIRLDSQFDASNIEHIAKALGIEPVYCRAYCMHGYTREETCSSCEGGYASDVHGFAKPRGKVARLDGDRLIAQSDDGSDALYIPRRLQPKIDKRWRELMQPIVEERQRYQDEYAAREIASLAIAAQRKS